jgi:hypothetical protein
MAGPKINPPEGGGLHDHGGPKGTRLCCLSDIRRHWTLVIGKKGVINHQRRSPVDRSVLNDLLGVVGASCFRRRLSDVIFTAKAGSLSLYRRARCYFDLEWVRKKCCLFWGAAQVSLGETMLDARLLGGGARRLPMLAVVEDDRTFREEVLWPVLTHSGFSCALIACLQPNRRVEIRADVKE